jgi:hypothetical protein
MPRTLKMSQQRLVPCLGQLAISSELTTEGFLTREGDSRLAAQCKLEMGAAAQDDLQLLAVDAAAAERSIGDRCLRSAISVNVGDGETLEEEDGFGIKVGAYNLIHQRPKHAPRAVRGAPVGHRVEVVSRPEAKLFLLKMTRCSPDESVKDAARTNCP